MQNQVKWLDFKITNRCNNNCVYCGVENDPPSAPEKLSFKVIKSTLQDALETNFNYICFLGGEPSIRKDIVKIIKVVGNRPELHLRIITNLKKYNLNMIKALFSTSSIDAEIVASFDNLSYPNYKKANPMVSVKRIELINNLAKRYQDKFRNKKKRAISLHSVISRENFYKIADFISYFFEKGIDISLGLVCPSIITSNPLAFNEFKKDEIISIIEQLNQLEQNNQLNFANSVLREFLREYISGNFSHKNECWAGKKQIIINSDGEVFPCISESYLSSKNYGNIRNERFKDVLKRLENFECTMAPNSACWDHFLWDKLAIKLETGD